MAFRAKFRKKPNISSAISSIVALVLTLWIGSDILTAVAVALNSTSMIFASALSILGFGETGGVMDGTVSTTGILSVIGLIAVFGIILSFVKFQFK